MIGTVGMTRENNMPKDGLATQRPLGAGGAKRRVAVYCRVSTDRELQEGSFELQERYYRELIDTRADMELAGIYGDKGKTGRSIAARPAFRRLLADCEAGRVDLILTKSVSRFARNVGECIEALRWLRQLGIPVLFEKENLNSMDAQGELVLSLFAAMAQEESNSISQNLLWSMERHNACGQPRFKPSYGYVKARGDWEWRVEEGQARRVRLAFALAAKGVCYGAIRAALGDMERKEGTGLDWTYRRLHYLLTNENYTGICLTNRYVGKRNRQGVQANRGERAQYRIEEHHQPLVSREVFELVQRKIRAGELQTRDMSRLHNQNAQRRASRAALSTQ